MYDTYRTTYTVRPRLGDETPEAVEDREFHRIYAGAVSEVARTFVSKADVILAEEAGKQGLTLQQILGKNRSRHFVDARRAAALRMRSETGMSLPAIGAKLKRNHTTILHYLGGTKASQKVKRYQETGK